MPHIYTIICLKSVWLSVWRRSHNAVRNSCSISSEMALTDRYLPRYFLSRVRVSIRPRFFLYAKNPQTSPRPGRMLQRHRPSERRNLKRNLYLHARWRLTSAAAARRLWMILLAPQNLPSLRKSYPRCNDPAKRGSVCEAFEKKPLPLALTLLLRYRYRPVLLGNNCER